MSIELIKLSEEHIYKVNGVIKPGVNEVLKDMGAIPDFNYPNAEYKRTLGTYVHLAIKLYFENKLDESSLQGEVKDYFNGFLKFHKENPINPLGVEKKFYSEKHGFCGTIDCWTDVLYDWKTGQSARYHQLTAGAYLLLLEEAGYKIERVEFVHLTPNDYKVVEIEADKQSFLAFLYAWKWLKRK